MAKKRKPTDGTFDFDNPGETGVVSGNGSGGDTAVALHEAAQSRYLNYALSVIKSRALPDVRDGLKPVQRRILYTMCSRDSPPTQSIASARRSSGRDGQLPSPRRRGHLRDARPDGAVVSLRYPLSTDRNSGPRRDPAAAMRIRNAASPASATNCSPRSSRTPCTIGRTTTAPKRSRWCSLRGSESAHQRRHRHCRRDGDQHPPHNLGEVCTALVKLLDNDELGNAQLSRYIKGPDFPTGGQILNSVDEIKAIYKTGSGSIRLRGTWDIGDETRSTKTIFIDSIPYTVDKSQLVAQIGEVIEKRKLPQLLDVKDVSTEDVRIAIEMKKDADEKMVMAYLYKHTALQITFPVNLTCLIPTENPEVGRPERLDLKSILWHFLHFRLEVVTARLEHELEALKRRVHILEGFEKVFDALDEVLRIVRKSDGKADAAEKIIKRFGLDAEQTDAILELKIYRLARLEILVIQQELDDKRKRARQIGSLLKNEESRWKLVREELARAPKTYAAPKLDSGGPSSRPRSRSNTPRRLHVEEDNIVIVSHDGWVKRQKEVKDLSTTRLREGDVVLAVLAGSTRSTVVFFTNFGTAYTARIIDVPASTGYGEPVQSLFKFKDGERVVAAASLDPRVAKGINAAKEGDVPPMHAVAVTSDGFSLRFSLEPFVEVSTRAGRRFARVAQGTEVVGVSIVRGGEVLIVATRQARALLCKMDEVNFLAGPGRGVTLIKLDKDDDRVVGFVASSGDPICDGRDHARGRADDQHGEEVQLDEPRR